MNQIKPISKSLNISTLVALTIVVIILAISMAGASSKRELMSLLWIIVGFAVVHVIVVMRIWYIAWKGIQDGHARTTPGKAVGFMFIPIFNMYWMFNMKVGFANDFNIFIKRHKLNASELPITLFTGTVVLQLITLILSRVNDPGILQFLMGLLLFEMVLTIVVMSMVIDSINVIAGNKEVISPESNQGETSVRGM